MSVGPDPQVDVDQLEDARRQINRLADEIAHLSEMEVSPSEYYGEFLQRVVHALAAPAGAVWLRTPQGNLQLQFQINMRQVGLDAGDDSREMHDELLRQAAMRGQPGMFWPHSSLAPDPNGGAVAGNPTDFVVLLAPILVDKQVAGLIEVWQETNRGPDAMRGFLQFMVRMAVYAASYTRNLTLRGLTGQQQIWTHLETFSRQIHSTLNPTEVSYLVANEGRRLCEADRVSVAIRQGPYAAVMAISGADVVEKRSNLVQLMRALYDAVIGWGERLVYSGTRDDTLPPAVGKALDAYLAESSSKLLIVMPLRDEREKENKKKRVRSAVMLECFDPSVAPDQMVARLEVVARHATPALYNSAEYKRIPMRFLWVPLAKLQEGLGGKARFILTLVGLCFVALTAVMVLVPYPLRMDASGQILPIERRWVYPTMSGQIEEIKESLKPGVRVRRNEPLMRMYSQDLADKITALQVEIETDQKFINEWRTSRDEDKKREVAIKEFSMGQKDRQLTRLLNHHNAVRNKLGHFWIASPLDGIILTGDFREALLHKPVRENEPLMRVGNAESSDLKDWEIELKIPQKSIGQVRAAYGYADRDHPGELDVDLLLVSEPTRAYKGKLHWNKIARMASPDRNDQNESEPVVIARVRVNGLPVGADGELDIPVGSQIPEKLLLTGTEVHARIRCGNHAMGYSLFHGVWEFIYEKIVFFF